MLQSEYQLSCLMLMINSYFCLMCLSQMNKLQSWLPTLTNHLSYLQRKFPVQICMVNDKIIYCCQLGYEVSSCMDRNELDFVMAINKLINCKLLKMIFCYKNMIGRFTIVILSVCNLNEYFYDGEINLSSNLTSKNFII